MNQNSATFQLRIQHLILLCLLLCGAVPAFANVYNVTQTSDGHGVTQLRGALEAADAAGPGPHTVNLPAGTYNLTLGEITFGNSAQTISIVGAGAASTIINMTATNQDRIFLINPPGTIAGIHTSISGIKFTNGHLTSDGYGGGALICGGPDNSMNITNCAFEGNSTPAASYAGGAVNMQGGGIISIDQCTFTNNNVNAMTGGAVQIILTNLPNLTGSASITNCTFTGNSNTSTFAPCGGALSIISDQGVAGQSFTTTIQKNTFINNFVSGIAQAGGGAIFISSGHQVNINYNRFYNNTVGTTKDALYVERYQGANTDATNNWWGSNDDPGAASTNSDKAYLAGTIGTGTLTISPRLLLKTTSANASICQSGGNTSISADFLTNSSGSSVSASNLTKLAGLPVSMSGVNGSLSNVQSSIQSNGKATATLTSSGTTGASSVNAWLDNVPSNDAVAKATLTVESTPTFTNQPTSQLSCGGSGVSFSATATSVSSFSYHWFKGVNSLNNGATGTGSTLSGVSTSTLTITNPGPSDVASNYKCVATNACGSSNSSNVALNAYGTRLYVATGGTGTGGSWATALGDLNSALATASSCSAITEIWVKAGTYLPSGKAYGQTTFLDRDRAFYLLNGVAIYGGFAGTETQLSQRNVNNNPTILSGDIGTPNDASDNSLHVVVSVNNNNTAILDGFTITGGRADYTALTNTIFGIQTPRYHGGGIMLISSSARIINCNFTSNAALYGGGGLFQSGGNVLVNACNFSNNYGQYGGAIRNESSPVLNVRNSVFRNNISSASGAGMSLYLGTDTLVNNLFIRNKDVGTTQGGGSICVATGDFYIVNNTFYADTTLGRGGSIRIESSTGTCKVFNNIFYKTYAVQGDNDVNNSFIAGYVQSNNSLSTSNPNFINENDFDGADNLYGTSDDGLKLNMGSNAINAGDNNKLPAGITTDIAGAARLQDVTVDAGCYENVAGTPVTYYRDVDGDTYGDAGHDTVAYVTVTGFVTNNTDCNDADASVHAPQQYYVDADGDGYGSTTTAMLCSYTAPAGYSTNNLDCDDAHNTVYPGASEICGNGIDDDCDGDIDEGCEVACTKAPKRPGGVSQIEGINKVCPGETRTYTIVPVSDADSYIWTIPAGAILVSGQGTAALTLSFDAGFTANLTLLVRSVNSCGQSQDRDKVIVRNVTPSTPGVITGPIVNTCSLTGISYSVKELPNINYVWSFTTPDGTVASGQGSHAILADFGSSFETTTVQVSATNGCGASALRSLVIKSLTPAPDTILGPKKACPGQLNVPYSIAAIPNASSYTWTGPSGSTISDGVTTSTGRTLTTTNNHVTINFGTASGSILVKATNACGVGRVASMAVTATCPIRMMEAAEEPSLFPNPAKDLTNVIFNAPQEGACTLQVYDALGKKVLEHTYQATEGNNRYQLHVNGLASGIYQLIISGKQLKYNARFAVE